MKPILFSTPMVQAILDGQKTMTRRVIKPQPTEDVTYLGGWKYSTRDRDTSLQSFNNGCYPETCKYQVGDVLWVRETWCPCEKYFGENEKGVFYYKADATPTSEDCRKQFGIPWHPSIFMPREAARIFLRVTDVRAERVQDISTSDCEEEGLISDIDRFKGQMKPHHDWIVGEFEKLWNSINAKRGYGWDANPWVWVISFERCEKPEAADA